MARIVAGRGEGSDCTMHAGGGKLFCKDLVLTIHAEIQNCVADARGEETSRYRCYCREGTAVAMGVRYADSGSCAAEGKQSALVPGN